MPGPRAIWKSGILSLGALAALAAGFSPAAALAPDRPVAIDFVKICPQSTCTGYLVRSNGDQIPNSSDFWARTSATVAWPLIDFTATETVASAHGSLTIESTGVINCGVIPTTVSATGTVVSGRWEGKGLSGSPITEDGHRVTNDTCTSSSGGSLAHTFEGSLEVFPGSND